MTLTVDLILPIVLCLFGSQGFWTWLMNKGNQSKLILSEVKALREDFDMEKAVNARTRIIRFNDELLNEIKHSKEMFDQVLGDIDTYEKYCASHPNFLNNKTVLSVSHIKKVYQECENNRTFL